MNAQDLTGSNEFAILCARKKWIYAIILVFKKKIFGIQMTKYYIVETFCEGNFWFVITSKVLLLGSQVL